MARLSIFNADLFAYNYCCTNIESVGSPTRLPLSLGRKLAEQLAGADGFVHEQVHSLAAAQLAARYLAYVSFSSARTTKQKIQHRLMALSHWRIFTDTKKSETAHGLVMKLQARIDHGVREINIDDYHKGGHVVTFHIEHEFDDWAATVYDVISCAQQMGHGWSLSGFIDEELNLVTTDTSIAGIKMVSCFCPRPGTANAK